MKDTTKGLIGLIAFLGFISLSGAVGARLAMKTTAAPPAADPPAIYIISASRFSFPDEDVWIVRYSINGQPCAVELPIKEGEPGSYLAYLRTLGRVCN